MRRIRRDEVHEEFIKELTTGDQPVFKDLWRVLLFASLLGHKSDRKVPLSGYDSGKAMPDSYFSNTPAWPGVLYVLGLVETNSTRVLTSQPEDEEDLIQIFEEYANGGLHILRERLGDSHERLKSMIDLLDEFSEKSSPAVPDLDSVTI